MKKRDREDALSAVDQAIRCINRSVAFPRWSDVEYWAAILSEAAHALHSGLCLRKALEDYRKRKRREFRIVRK